MSIRMTIVHVVIGAVLLTEIGAIWPPPYSIDLQQSETFDVSDLWNSDDDEIIIPKRRNVEKERVDGHKLFRLHRMAKRHNQKVADSVWDTHRKIEEENFDAEEPMPWQAGYVDKNGNFIQPVNENVYYINEMAKSVIDQKIKTKRDESGTVHNSTNNENDDYLILKQEYLASIKAAKNRNDTLNFTDVKENESVAEAIDDIVHLDARNCSAEENKGIGISALKCLWHDDKVASRRKFVLLSRIVLIWLCIYMVIAISCWCQKGWCCCCCPCRACRPLQLIDEAKELFINNPPGVYRHYVNDEEEKLIYPPTVYEVDAQKRLEKALMKL